jgi:hypothetical protein
LYNGAAEFMTEYDGIIDGPAVVGCPLVKVAAAYAYVGYFKEDVFIADCGLFDFPDFD